MMLQAQQNLKELIEFRRHLHQWPETGFNEIETSKYISHKLTDIGVEVIDLKLKSGVVGLIKGKKPGPTIALRADIDALPIQEKTDVEYKSKNLGVMHACGHDVHAACLFGAAKMLISQQDNLCGNVKLLFQPAEEIDEGAKHLIEMGALGDVQAIFGLHNAPEIPVGQIGIKAGPLMASIDRFVIKISGVGGHGAQPQNTKDPIVATAAIIQALQTIVSRNVGPMESAVVSCCSIRGGDAYNIIPEQVEILGTVRTFDPNLREVMPKKIESMVSHVAAGFGTTATLEYCKELPALINPESLAVFCNNSANTVFGEQNIICPIPSMGGEDFAIYQQQVPGVFLFLGVGNKAKGIDKPWHSPHFVIDEQGIAYGAVMLAQLAQDYLKK